MDFDGAISAHVEWKTKLRNYIAKPDQSLNPATIALDNQCALGKWIHGEGAGYASTPEFAKLKSEHARFHKTAAEVVRTADTGNAEKASEMIGAGSEYMTISMSVVTLIRTIRTIQQKAAK